MILTVTLNAAIDKRYVVKGFETDRVNRVTECAYSAGGKGINVSRNLVIAGEKVTATGFLGGHAGHFIEEEVIKAGIISEFVFTNGESRSCINIYDETAKTQTEFLEPGSMISEDEIKQFLHKYEELLPECEAVTISGSVPKGVDSSTYCKLITLAKIQNKPVLLDTSGKLLEECLASCPTLIKPNKDEIQMLTGRKLNGIDEIKAAAAELHKKGIDYVVVSLGEEGSLLVTPEACYKASVPKITAVNTVGCGDAMLAGLAITLAKHLNIEEGLRLASAISAANALRQETGFFIKEDMERILSDIIIRKI